MKNTYKNFKEITDKRADFELRKTIEQIKNSIKNNYSAHKVLNKPFYNFYELSGWRFYLKAIRYKDWRSIKKYIRLLFNNPK